MKISQQIISNLKKGGADFFLSVPCKLLANMITILEADNDIYYSAIPREEEGMGICAGAYLGNKLPCIMMQNTGIGNSVNSIVSPEAMEKENYWFFLSGLSVMTFFNFLTKLWLGEPAQITLVGPTVISDFTTPILPGAYRIGYIRLFQIAPDDVDARDSTILIQNTEKPLDHLQIAGILSSMDIFCI